MEAKWVEIDLLKQFGVFKPMPKSEVLDHKMLSKRWVKARKKDKIRMRFVAREFRSAEDRNDLFTPSTTSSTER
eukprot:12018447-Heterocapsa_arctica.AAC.1